MGLSIGIIGLPNVGKSTVFNALTGAQNAEVANYPFCTIKPNRAIVPVPDIRVDKIAELVKVPNRIYATIEFVDIAGLVRGASHGEGLGNQFLGNIRDTYALVHVIRCFEDPNVVHVSRSLNPLEDIETIEIELALSDLQQLERKIERLTSAVKGDKRLQSELDLTQSLYRHIQEGKPVSSYPDQENKAFQKLVKEMRFLTAKPLIFAANVDENAINKDNPYVKIVQEAAKERGAEVVVLSAQLELELQDMDEDERKEFLQLEGIEKSSLEQVIIKGFHLLNLISFFTKNENEVRAWNIQKGSTAPQAAGVIHTDFERGFIRAEVVPYNIFVQYGSDAAVKSAGLMRLEGKQYIIQDGDLIYFRINV